jgi:hypothetical protein
MMIDYSSGFNHTAEITADNSVPRKPAKMLAPAIGILFSSGRQGRVAMPLNSAFPIP